MSSQNVAIALQVQNRAQTTAALGSVSSSLQGIENNADGASRGFGRMGQAAKAAGRMAVAGFAVAGAAAAGFAYKSIQGASDLNEATSKAKVIFGKNFRDIVRFSRRAAMSIGLSQKEALGAASGFGDMFSQIGFTADESARLSKSVVTMAADLGSFNNLPTAEVLDMIAGGFRGEYDSLQRVIPNINAARVETQALTMTGKENAAALTAQEKAAATWAIVAKDGARATGDFNRTRDGFANQSKILQARLENLSDRFGKKLLPIAVKVLQWLNKDGIKYLRKFGRWVEDAGSWVQETWDKVAGFFSGDGAGSGALGEYIQYIRDLFASVSQIVTDVIATVRAAWSVFGDEIVAILGAAARAGMTFFRSLFGTFANIFRAIRAIVTGDWSALWEAVKDQAKLAWEWVKTIVKTGITVLWNMIKGSTEFLSKAWDNVWTGIKELAREAWEWLKQKAGEGLQKLKVKVGEGVQALKDKAVEKFQELIDYIKSLPGKIKEAGKDIAGAILDLAPGGGLIKDGLGVAGGLLGKIGLANGGGVQPGKAYTVGERGRETFIPTTPGVILPNSFDDWQRAWDDDATLTAGGGDGQPMVVQVVMPDGRVLAETVIKEATRIGARR